MSAAPYTPAEYIRAEENGHFGDAGTALQRLRATVDALAAVTAERDAAREEQREACALALDEIAAYPEGSRVMLDEEHALKAIRATPLAATPLADRIKELEGGSVLGVAWRTERVAREAAEARVKELEAELVEASSFTQARVMQELEKHGLVGGATHAAVRAELAAETALVEATRAEMVRQAELAHDSARADRERIGVLEAAMRDFSTRLRQSPCVGIITTVADELDALSATPEAAIRVGSKVEHINDVRRAECGVGVVVDTGDDVRVTWANGSFSHIGLSMLRLATPEAGE